jgi:hypothetical protein
MKPLTLHQRCEYYNAAFPPPPLTISRLAGKEFIYGFWFYGGSRHSDFYGAYHQEYLTRITSLFPDAKSVLHLFSGSLPASSHYTRVGIDPSGKGTTADIVGDAEHLSAFLPFKPDIVYADPPYTNQEAEEDYQISLVNGPRVLDEVGIVLQPGGYLVWLDQRIPVFSNERLRLVGVITNIRSTGNRLRAAIIFQKPANAK